MTGPVEFLNLDDLIELARRMLGDPPPVRYLGARAMLGVAIGVAQPAIRRTTFCTRARLGPRRSGPLDAYVRVGELESLLEEVPMEEGARNFNVRLRVVQDACWPFPPGAAAAPLAVVAVDLADSSNARERRLGVELLGRL